MCSVRAPKNGYKFHSYPAKPSIFKKMDIILIETSVLEMV